MRLNRIRTLLFVSSLATAAVATAPATAPEEEVTPAAATAGDTIYAGGRCTMVAPTKLEKYGIFTDVGAPSSVRGVIVGISIGSANASSL